jgi:hypothetical protein
MTNDEWQMRPVDIGASACHMPDSGLNLSTEFSSCICSSSPPTTYKCPLMTDAECEMRLVDVGASDCHMPDTGFNLSTEFKARSYSSAPPRTYKSPLMPGTGKDFVAALAPLGAAQSCRDNIWLTIGASSDMERTSSKTQVATKLDARLTPLVRSSICNLWTTGLVETTVGLGWERQAETCQLDCKMATVHSRQDTNNLQIKTTLKRSCEVAKRNVTCYTTASQEPPPQLGRRAKKTK